jgi:hypothetical protein
MMEKKYFKILIFSGIIAICFAIGSFVFANLQSNPSASSGQAPSASSGQAIEQFENKIVEQLSDEPQILSISANPGKVKIGDILFITAEIKDRNGVEKVSAIMPHDNGSDEIQLSLISGGNKSGTWQGEWKCYDTINKEYVTTVTAINILGESVIGEVSWWDDTETVWWHGEGWLSGWTKRKKIAVAGSTAGAQTNYQVEVTVAYDSDMQADFDDIRFTKSDGSAALDFWLESKTNSVTADFWVEIDSIPASPNTVDIYFYYGNSSASSASNGVNTFLFFDDFKTNTIATKWQVASGTWSIDTGNERLVSDSTGDTFIKANFSEPNDWVIDVDTYFTNDNNWGSIFGRFQDTNNLYAGQLCLGGGADNISIVEVTGGSWVYLTGAYLEKDYALSTWYHIKFQASGSDFDIWEGATHLSGSDSTLSSGDVGLHGGNNGATAYDIYFKTYRVRKFASPEPSVGTAGSEESTGSGNWPLRKKITLSSATTLANYQVKVDLTTAIMGNPYTNVQTDGDDIRFVQADGTLLDYWVETWSATGNSTLWVEVASSGTSVIYMYYNSPSASSASNGDNTFVFFEDWETDYTSSYTAYGPTTYKRYLRSATFPSSNYKHMTRFKVTLYQAQTYGSSGFFGAFKEATSTPDNRVLVGFFNDTDISGVDSDTMAFRLYTSVSNTDYASSIVLADFATDTWYKMEVDVISGTSSTAKMMTDDYSSTINTVTENHAPSGIAYNVYGGNSGGSQTGTNHWGYSSSDDSIQYGWDRAASNGRIQLRSRWTFTAKYAATDPTTTVSSDEEKRPYAPGASPSGGGSMIF